jgi:hypothetical protein
VSHSPKLLSDQLSTLVQVALGKATMAAAFHYHGQKHWRESLKMVFVYWFRPPEPTLSLSFSLLSFTTRCGRTKARIQTTAFEDACWE